PHVTESPVAAEAAPALPPAPDNGGGYSLSEHVKRYYRTAAA
ncbi:MAG: formate dehydrogenase, partial [Variovorax sp.]